MKKNKCKFCKREASIHWLLSIYGYDSPYTCEECSMSIEEQIGTDELPLKFSKEFIDIYKKVKEVRC